MIISSLIPNPYANWPFTLAQLMYNFIAWIRNGLASCQAQLCQFGMLRMVRDAFHIPDCLSFDARGHIV